MENTTKHSNKAHLPLLILLFVMGFSIRLMHLNAPPLDFHPTRQYRFLMIARDFYLADKELSPTEHKVWSSNQTLLNKLEPPILEKITSWGYQLIGEEVFWFPRLLNIIFWMLGALLLYFIARRLASISSALVACGVFILLPYGVQASRALMPEALMLLLLMASCLALLRYDDKPSIKNLLIASTLSALAVFIKTGFCLFVLYGIFLALLLHKKSTDKRTPPIHIALFLILSIFPSLIYLFFSIKENSSGRFFISLLFELSFWKELLNMLNQVYSYPLLVLAILGFLKCHNKKTHYFLLGALAGFILFSGYFTYHIQTHNYYHLQFLPFMCLALMPAGQLFLDFFVNKNKKYNVALYVVLAIICALSFRQSRLRIKQVDYSVTISKKYDVHTNFKDEIKIFEEIGELCQHSTKTIILSYAYGAPLMYHGKVSGSPWNKKLDYSVMKLKGLDNTSPNIEKQFKRHDTLNPKYFVVTDFRTYSRDFELQEYLKENFSIIKENKHYIIFDMK